MKILAINTSGSEAEVCVKDEEKYYQNKIKSPYSENAMVCVEETLRSANLDISDVDVFGVVVGPGSFTGIRIGLALVKGFLCAVNKKCVSINSFELVSYNVKDDDFVVVLDSGNADFYYAIFKDKKAKEMGFGTLENIAGYAKKEKLNVYCSSNEVEKFEEYKSFNIIPVKMLPNTLANLCQEKSLNNEFVGIQDISPIYIKYSQAEIGLEKNMKEHLSFRDATIGDENALSIIDKQCFDGHEKYDEKSFVEELTEKSKHYYVALYDNLVIGYVGVQILGEELNLLKIAVLPQYRKLGVGFKLMSHTFDYRKQNQLTNYFLEVKDNNESAKKLYQKFGFKTKSTRKSYYDDGTDALVMFTK